MENSSKPIVVGVDGSRYSREALRWALEEANRRDCPVRALLVWHADPMVAAGRPTTIGVGTQLSADPGSDYLRTLDNTVRGVLGEHDDPRLSAEVVHGATVDVLTAASTDAQLLVLGSHGHGRLFEAALGTVSQHCVRHAACPVVIIPAGLAPADVGEETARPATAVPMTYGPGPLL
jgi:nucleotide-binding universal stress UspA family protein